MLQKVLPLLLLATQVVLPLVLIMLPCDALVMVYGVRLQLESFLVSRQSRSSFLPKCVVLRRLVLVGLFNTLFPIVDIRETSLASLNLITCKSIPKLAPGWLTVTLPITT